MPNERSQSLETECQHNFILKKGPEKTFKETENKLGIVDEAVGGDG